MSTIKKLGGKQFSLMGENRKAALAFYRDKSRLPGVAGAIAAEIYRTLNAIHHDPSFNSAEKEHAFRNIIRRFARGAGDSDVPTRTAAGAEEALRVAGLSAIEGVPAVKA